jgi:hypothetical protein
MRDPLEQMRYGVFAAVLISASSLACAKGSAPEPRAAEVGTYTPSSVVLYLARGELTGTCGDDLAQAIQFAPEQTALTPAQMVEVAKWALCMQRPGLREANVVLVPPRAPGSAALFSERAKHIRDALAARGVASGRITVAPATSTGAASVAGGPASDEVRIEVARPAGATQPR